MNFSEKTHWSPLDHKIWNQQSTWPRFKKILIAISGGVDSLVLLSIFKRLASIGSFEIIAASVHHGPGSSEKWRFEARQFCQNFCQNLGVSLCHGGPSPIELSSENEFRDYRYLELRRIKLELSCDLILTAHHSDDLFETRFLRLLRGTGPQGLDGLKSIEGELWRPLLEISKMEILKYAKDNQIKYIEDPSNKCIDPMRNWLRQELFPQIEGRQSGLLQNLNRSLQLLVESLQNPIQIEIQRNNDGILGIERSLYLTLNESDQRRVLAKLLYELGIKDYSLGQIKEIQKRLDNLQKVHSFILGTVLWKIDARQILVNSMA